MSNISLIDGHIDNAEHCVCCGAVIPEGRQVCIICGLKTNYKQSTADVVEVVRCKDCIYFQDRYIELPDGSKRLYKKGESSVPISVGINVGAYCTRIDYAIVHGYRDGEPSVDETRLWTKPDDFCSHGERKDEK